MLYHWKWRNFLVLGFDSRKFIPDFVENFLVVDFLDFKNIGNLKKLIWLTVCDLSKIIIHNFFTWNRETLFYELICHLLNVSKFERVIIEIREESHRNIVELEGRWIEILCECKWGQAFKFERWINIWGWLESNERIPEIIDYTLFVFKHSYWFVLWIQNDWTLYFRAIWKVNYANIALHPIREDYLLFVFWQVEKLWNDVLLKLLGLICSQKNFLQLLNE